MKNNIELLAPGGNINSIKAAIIGGADAVYCGLDRFNARNSAEKIGFNDLQGILNLAHKHTCKVFLTLNIIILENEIKAVVDLLNKLVNTSVDGVIVQDLGLLYLLNKHFRTLKIHASTQVTTHNYAQIKFLNSFNIDRVNLARELNINEIKYLTKVANENNIETEVFVHGSYCISFSGICYISSVQTGNSGNRGRCSQPCRAEYANTDVGANYPLNLKDNSAFNNLGELVMAGVTSLKIEGRIKKYDYVYTAVNTWRKHIDEYFKSGIQTTNNKDLYKIFNRDFTNGFIEDEISKNMFIDNPRDNSIKHLSEINNFSNKSDLEKASLKLYAQKDAIKISVEQKLNNINIAKKELTIAFSGKQGEKLWVEVQINDKLITVCSETNLLNSTTETLNYDIIYKRFKVLNETEYFIKSINLDRLSTNVFIPYKELVLIRKQVFFELNNAKAFINPVEVLSKKNEIITTKEPELSVLISSKNDLNLCDKINAIFYFKMPSSFTHNYSEYIQIFRNNKQIIPWFSPILIGYEFDTAMRFLKEIKPKLIISNNTGLGFEAYKNNIDWIAGPQLNIVNSYSLQALKEHFNCSGAFISNEINKHQIKNITKPENFYLHYSIYHPIVTMTSRQCLFQQVTGCEKYIIDNTCISHCEKHSSIINTKQDNLFINKTKGNYNELYNHTNFLNTEIITDLPNLFSNYMIDLSSVKTETEITISKLEIIKHFENYLNGNLDSKNILNNSIYPTTNVQYVKGL